MRLLDLQPVPPVLRPIRFHLLPKAPRSHVGPHLVDVLKALVFRPLESGLPPAVRNRSGTRPDRVLLFIVGNHEIAVIRVFVPVGHGNPPAGSFTGKRDSLTIGRPDEAAGQAFKRNEVCAAGNNNHQPWTCQPCHGMPDEKKPVRHKLITLNFGWTASSLSVLSRILSDGVLCQASCRRLACQRLQALPGSTHPFPGDPEVRPPGPRDGIRAMEPESFRHHSRAAIALCNLFPAWLKVMLAGPSSMSAVTSSPLCAERSCMNTAFGLSCQRSADTPNGANIASGSDHSWSNPWSASPPCR